jgi:hypothetical protein
VPLAIVLRLDVATASRVAALVEALPDRVREVGAIRQSYPAHVVLATYGDQVDVADLDAALATWTGCWPRLPIILAGVGVFPADPPGVCLLLAPSIDLLKRHSTLHRALADLRSHYAYDVDGWVPHVILARTNLVGDAVEVLTSIWTGPITGWLESLDLVRLDPVEVLSARPLRG